jgi:hypothetical protein
MSRWYCPVCTSESGHPDGSVCIAREFHEWPIYVVPVVRTNQGPSLGSVRITCDQHDGAWMKPFPNCETTNREAA